MTELWQSCPDLHSAFKSFHMHPVRQSDHYEAGILTDIKQVLMRAIKSHSSLTHGCGMSESVRVTWIQMMHICAAVFSAIMNLVETSDSTDIPGHRELRAAWMKRDHNDVMKFISWFEEHNPFDSDDCTLHSLTSGIASSDTDDVNCDSAESVGESILNKFDNMPFTDVVSRKVDHVVPLSALLNKLTVAKKKVQMDPIVLFTRLLLVMQ